MNSHLKVLWGCVELADYCRAAAARDARTVTGWVPVVPTVWRPAADVVNRSGSCVACCDCPAVGGAPDDVLNPAPWYDPSRLESAELWAIQPREIVQQNGWLTSEGGNETTVGVGRCTVGNWLLTIDLYGSEKGRRYGLAWLNSILAGCGTTGGCVTADLEIEAVCGETSTVRDVRATVIREVQDETSVCVTRVEILFESPDSKLWQAPVWVLDETDPWETVCNPLHPMSGKKCECDDTVPLPDLCLTPVPSTWPGDPTTIGCAVTPGDGDDSPLTNVVVSPAGHSVFDIVAAVPDLVAPLTIAISTPPSFGSLTVGARTVVWSGLANLVGAHRAALTVTDADGRICPVALGVLVLPCCDPVERVGPQTFDEEPSLTKNGDACEDPAPPFTECYYPAAIGNANWLAEPAPRCINPGDTAAGWVVAFQHFGPAGHGVGVAPYIPGEIRIPIPQAVASWSWTVTGFSGATFTSAASGTSSTDIVVTGVVLPSAGIAHGSIFVQITPTHDGSDNDFGDITGVLTGGGLASAVATSGASPPICACAPTDCGCAPEALTRHGTIVSVDDQTVVWTVPDAYGPIVGIATPAFGTITVVGSDVVWSSAPNSTTAWSDVVSIDIGGCSAVLVNHHTAMIAPPAIDCGVTIAPPTVVVPDVCVVDECPPVQIETFCVTVPSSTVGADILVEFETTNGKVEDLVTRWYTGCGCVNDEFLWWCCDPDGVRKDTYPEYSLIELATAGNTITTQTGVCELNGKLPAASGCCDTTLCFRLPAGAVKPSRVRVGWQQWLL